jgi:WD40 repeat protein
LADGRTLAAVLADGRIGLWDLATGRHQAPAVDLGTNNLAVLPAIGGELFIPAGDPVRIKVYDVRSGTLEEYPAGWTDRPNKFWLSPLDSMLLASRCQIETQPGPIHRWHARTRRALPDIQDFGAGTEWNWRFEIAFSSDSPRMAIAWRDRIELRNLETGREEGAFALFRPQGLDFVPNKGLLLGASAGSPAVRVWDLDTREEVATLGGHNLVLATIHASADGERIVTSTIGQEPIRVWDTASWEQVFELDLPGTGLRGGRFLGDGNALVAWDSSGHLHVWRAPTMNEIEAAVREARQGR